MGQTRQQRGQLTAEREARLKQVAALRLAGVRDQQTIAQRLGVSAATMCRDFAEVDARWRKESVADIDAAKGQDLERLEAMLLGIWQDATKGKWLAVDRALRILERRAAMYGYDAPKRSELTGRDGEALRIEVEQRGGLTDEERVERLVALYERVRTRTVRPADGGPALALGAPAGAADGGVSE